MGFTLRSLLLAEGIRGITTRMNPPTVLPAGSPTAERWAGPARPRFLGFDPSESSWQLDRGLIRQLLDAPLGLSLPGLDIGDLARAFARTPLSRFAGPAIARRVGRRLRVSVSLRPASPDMGAETPCPEKQPS